MDDSGRTTLRKRAVRMIRSMWPTFDSIQEALKRLRFEIEAQPEVLGLLSELEGAPIDLIERLEADEGPAAMVYVQSRGKP